MGTPECLPYCSRCCLNWIWISSAVDSPIYLFVPKSLPVLRVSLSREPVAIIRRHKHSTNDLQLSPFQYTRKDKSQWKVRLPFT